MKRWKIVRRGLLATGLLVAFIGVWYAQGRVFRETNAIRIVRLDDPGEAAQPDLVRPGGRLRVAAHNIAHGRGGQFGASNAAHPDRAAVTEHLQRIAALLVELDLDIVVLNEVDFDARWSHRMNQAEVIAQAAGFKHRVEQRNIDVSLPGYRLRFGNVILSRYPIEDAALVRFPPYSPIEDLLAGNHDGVCATIRTPTGPVRVLAVHLEVRDEATRVAAARAMLELEAASQVPLIALGDLNSTLPGLPAARFDPAGDNAMAVLRDSGRFLLNQNAHAAAMTFPSAGPTKLIDWILVSPPLTITATQVIDSELSDHRPVVAELVIGATTRGSATR